MDLIGVTAHGAKLAGLLEGILKMNGHLQAAPKTVAELVDAASAVLAGEAQVKRSIPGQLAEPTDGHAQRVWLVTDAAGEHVMMCPRQPGQETIDSVQTQIGQAVAVEEFLLTPASLVDLVDVTLLPPPPQPYGRFNINGTDGHRIKGYTAEQMVQAQKQAVALDRHAHPRIAQAPTPVIVLEVDNGTFKAASGSHPAHVIILDADTEGGDHSEIMDVLGDEYYVTHMDVNAAQDEPGFGADLVARVQDDLAAAEAAVPQEPYLTGHWGHIFANQRQESTVRLVFHTLTNEIRAMDILTGRGYVPASKVAIADVLDSILNGNPYALEMPEEYGLERVATLPDWAAQDQAPSARVDDDEDDESEGHRP